MVIDLIPVDFDGAAPSMVAGSQIEQTMAQAGLAPPAGYTLFARANGGMHFSGATRFVRNAESGEAIGLSTIYHYDPAVRMYSVMDIQKQMTGLVPDGLFPIMSTEFGGEICLDYRAGDGEPSVVLYDYEAQQGREIGKIAPTFSAFLASIGPRPEE